MTKTKKEELRKVPTKNYIILAVIFCITFFLVFYLYRYYVVYSEYQKETPVIRGSLPEITNYELQHYVQDSPTIVIYMCPASDDACRNFEKSFKKLIEKEDLSTYITYVNLTNVDLKQFTSNFNDTYEYKQDLKNNYPALVVFEDGEVRDIIQASDKDKLSINKVYQFLERNKIGE